MKKIIILIILFTAIPIILAYTPPNYNDIDLVLEGDYTPPNYNDIDLVLGEAPVDTCSCPGAGNNWEIDMSDYCNITSDCDLTTGKLNFTGSGKTRINATIKTTDLGDPGANGMLKIQDSGTIYDSG